MANLFARVVVALAHTTSRPVASSTVRPCRYQFSVTSGTIFASRKLDFTDLLAAVCLFVNGAKGMSMLQMARDLDVQYKTAFVLCHKLREALAGERDGAELNGVVEVDGMHVGGHIRPENEAKDRVDRRLAQHQTGKRRVVVAFREREGGRCRSLPSTKVKALRLLRSMLTAWPSFMLTKHHIGMVCMPVGKLSGSTTVRPIRWMAVARTRLKVISRGCAE